MGSEIVLSKRSSVRYRYFSRNVMSVVRSTGGSLALFGRFVDGTLVYMNWSHDGNNASDEWDVIASNNTIKIVARAYGDGNMGISRMTSDFMDIVMAHREGLITRRHVGPVRLRLSVRADPRVLKRVFDAGDMKFLPTFYDPNAVSSDSWRDAADTSIYCSGIRDDDDVAIGIVNALSVLSDRCDVIYGYNEVESGIWVPSESTSVPASLYKDHYEKLADIAVKVAKVTGYTPLQTNRIVFDELVFATYYNPPDTTPEDEPWNRGFYNTGTKICFYINRQGAYGDNDEDG